MYNVALRTENEDVTWSLAWSGSLSSKNRGILTRRKVETMEPVSLIVTALAAGAAAAAKPVATDALRAAYDALKRILQDRYDAARESVEHLEKAPDKEARQDGVGQELTALGATTDAELVTSARDLMDAIVSDDPEVARSFGLHLVDFRAGELNVRDIEVSAGEGPVTGVKVEGADIDGAATFDGIRVTGGQPHPKRQGK